MVNKSFLAGILTTSLFTSCITSAEPIEEISLSQRIYNEALNILQQYPQFSHDSRVNSENKIVIDVPMDYDLDYTKAIYQIEVHELSEDRVSAKQLLEESSNLGNVDATYLLAEMNFYGNYSYPTNGSLALEYYKKVTELEPNATAYFNVAFIYSTGLFGQLEVDQAKANLYYNFAFEQGDIRAAMVLGYRYALGISVVRDLSTSMFYYQYVADKMKAVYDSAPIGGPNFDSYSIRVPDFQGGVYGKGVGDISSSLTRSANRFNDYLTSNALDKDGSLFDELYFKVLKYYEGSYLKKRNFKDAFQLAKFAMEHGLQQIDTIGDLDKKYLSGCIYTIGRMYLRGEGVTQDYEEALNHFTKSIQIYPFAHTYNDLGMLYEFAPEPRKNLEQAYNMYERATNLTAKVGLYNLGRLTFPKNPEKGIEKIKKASYHLDVPAIYYNTELMSLENSSRNKDTIVKNLKYYCERFDHYLTSLEWSFFELIHGRHENGLIGYAMAAEQGFETAQVSTGFLLYQLPPILEFEPPRLPKERKNMALTYLTRSSMQYNVDSTVIVGDIYFAEGDYEKAAAAYDAASTRGSSQGNFNLGWLHEQGYGVEKDFHLAKRHYDLSLHSHPKAYLPVQLALLRLRFKSFINNITGGKVNGINDGQEKRTWSDWKALYHKIRGTNDEYFENNVNDEPLGDPETPALEYEDLIMIAMMFIPFALIFMYHFFQQMQIRRRRANGENVPGPNFEVNFRIIAI